MHIKTLAHNTLAIANKCINLLPITVEETIKMKGEQDKRYTQFSSQKLLPSRILSQYTSSEYFAGLNHRKFFGKHHTGVYFLFHFPLQVLLWTNPSKLSIFTDK